MRTIVKNYKGLTLQNASRQTGRAIRARILQGASGQKLGGVLIFAAKFYSFISSKI